MSKRRQTPRRTLRAPVRRGMRAVVAWLALGATAVAAAMAYVSMRATSPTAVPASAAVQQRAPVYGYDVVAEFPHDPGAFTQGLIYWNGFLFESTGLHGRSTLRRVELETGRVVQQRPLEDRYFAEGLTNWGDRLIQLTYQTSIGFVYDLKSFEPRSSFVYPGEGWGLTHDGRRLIMSDGSSSLRFLDPETLQEQGRLRVTDGTAPVDQLNELEFVDGQIYANVWHADRIAMIDPASGRVAGWIDLTGLRPSSARDPEAVLNGIAWDASRERLFVTGKLWPRLYEIRIRRDPDEGGDADEDPGARQDQSRPARARRAGRRVPRAADRLPGDRAP